MGNPRKDYIKRLIGNGKLEAAIEESANLFRINIVKKINLLVLRSQLSTLKRLENHGEITLEEQQVRITLITKRLLRLLEENQVRPQVIFYPLFGLLLSICLLVMSQKIFSTTTSPTTPIPITQPKPKVVQIIDSGTRHNVVKQIVQSLDPMERNNKIKMIDKTVPFNQDRYINDAKRDSVKLVIIHLGTFDGPENDNNDAYRNNKCNPESQLITLIRDYVNNLPNVKFIVYSRSFKADNGEGWRLTCLSKKMQGSVKGFYFPARILDQDNFDATLKKLVEESLK